MKSPLTLAWAGASRARRTPPSLASDPTPLEVDDRRLIRESDDKSLRFLLLKLDDVLTYVEWGTADLGVR